MVIERRDDEMKREKEGDGISFKVSAPSLLESKLWTLRLID